MTRTHFKPVFPLTRSFTTAFVYACIMMHVCAYVCLCLCFVSPYTHTETHMYMFVYTCVCVCACVRVCTELQIYWYSIYTDSAVLSSHSNSLNMSQYSFVKMYNC